MDERVGVSQELAGPLQQAALRKVWCYPVQFAVPAPRPPLVEHFLDRDQALLRYLGETQILNATYLQKLVSFCTALACLAQFLRKQAKANQSRERTVDGHRSWAGCPVVTLIRCGMNISTGETSYSLRALCIWRLRTETGRCSCTDHTSLTARSIRV